MSDFKKLMTGAATYANPILGAGMGMLLQDRNRELNMADQRELHHMQVAGQKDVGSYMSKLSHDLQYDMWQKTNAPAQAEQLRKAGLNVGLMYGGSGAGGTTTGAGAVAGSVGRGNSNVGPADIGMGLELAMMKIGRAHV